TFNASHRAIKDAIKRAVELEQVLSEPRLHDLERAREAQSNLWTFLEQEADIADDLRMCATELEDLLQRETFFKELPAIEQHTRALELEYQRRFDEALDARVAAYTKAFDELVKTPGWTEIDEDQQRRLAEPFERGMKRDETGVTIPQLRADRDACDGRLRAAIAELRRIIDGERVVTVSVASYFAGGIEAEEQLEAALDALREECARLIGAGETVIIQQGTPTMDKDTRNAIERATQRARKLLEEDFAAQLEGTFDVLMDGSVAPTPGAHLSARQAFQRERIVAAIEHKRAAGMSAADAVRDYLRDAAFTTLNRFVALKMLEARE